MDTVLGHCQSPVSHGPNQHYPLCHQGPLAVLGHPQGFSVPSPSPVSSGGSSFLVFNLDVAGSPPYHANTAPGELRGIDYSPDFTSLPGDGEGPIPGPSLATHWPGLAACSGIKPQPMLTLGTSSGTVCGFSVASVMSDFVTPWTAVHQAPLSMGFSRQEYLGHCIYHYFHSLMDLSGSGVGP